MTPTNMTQLLDFYAKTFADNACVAVEGGDAGNHAYWMCGRTKQFIDEHRLDKSLRWVGFIQGVLYCQGIFSIEQLKDHTRKAKQCEPTPA